MKRLVVATGGGAVVRPVNWYLLCKSVFMHFKRSLLEVFLKFGLILRRYMKEGISVWLDVPLEALARRIAAVSTASRPLLDQESGDPYTKVPYFSLTVILLIQLW